MLPDTTQVSTLLREAAAELILPRFQHLEAGDIQAKSPGDLVTIADIETEQRLTPLLRDLVPGSLVVGEEAASKDPSVMDQLAGDTSVWVIDPVDGTANFAAGISLFAVMVSFVQAGEVVQSWILDPVKDQMAIAGRGEGAWLDGKRMSVAPPATPDHMSGSLALRFGNRQLVRKIAGRSNLIGSVFSFRCAGQEYLSLASGRAHFALYHRLLPWDHAAGWLLHREAGGYSRRLDGSHYTPRTFDGGLLLTPDETSWNALHDVLIGGEEQI
jgi:fructose-1,6-bisphosphatase/inositol monophosphatase family enzyme